MYDPNPWQKEPTLMISWKVYEVLKKKMTQKKLQKDSILNQYDLDGDNTITDEELQRAKRDQGNRDKITQKSCTITHG